MEIEEDFNPLGETIYKKCICGYPCPDASSYNRHIEECEVYKAEQITKNKKFQKEKEKETPFDTLNNATSPIIPELNLEELRLTDDAIPSVKLFVIVPVRKPLKQEFFRVRDGWHFETKILEIQEDREFYLVAKPLWEPLDIELRSVDLYAAINQDRILFLIPVTILGAGGRKNRWAESLLNIIDRAKSEWVRSVGNMSVGSYEPIIALHNLGEPQWPKTVMTRNKEEVELTMEVLITTAFFGKYIDSLEHPIVKRLLGEIA